MKSLIILSILGLSCVASAGNTWTLTVKDSKSKATKIEYKDPGTYDIPLMGSFSTKCKLMIEEPFVDPDSKNKKDKLQDAVINCSSGKASFRTNLICAVPPEVTDTATIPAMSIVEEDYNRLSVRCSK